MALKLDDTTRCPLGVRCESCGVERPDLAVCTVSLGRLGVACMTMCERCRSSSVAPPITVAAARRLVGQHASHLGITVDEAAAMGERP